MRAMHPDLVVFGTFYTRWLSSDDQKNSGKTGISSHRVYTYTLFGKLRRPVEFLIAMPVFTMPNARLTSVFNVCA